MLVLSLSLIACARVPTALNEHFNDPIPEGAAVQALSVSLAEYLAAEPTASSAATVGPYPVRSYSEGIPLSWDASYATPGIFHPVGGDGKFPGVVFIPGNNDVWWESPDTLLQWGRLLASHGFVVLFINPADLVAMPKKRAAVLLEAMNLLATENRRVTSPLKGRIDVQRLAVMGHSFGGSGALYAADANADPRLKAVVGLNPVPHLDDPGYRNIRVPSLLVAGEGDPYVSSNLSQYESIPAGTPKILVEFSRTSDVVEGSMHFVAHSPLGKHLHDPTVARMTLSFLKVFLANDARYLPLIRQEEGVRAFHAVL